MRISDWCSDVCSSDLETPVGEIIERRSVALLEMKIVQSRFTDATNACRNQVRGDVDAKNPGASPRGWQGGCPDAATKIQDVHPGANIQCGDERVSRPEEPTSELHSLMRNSSAVFCF